VAEETEAKAQAEEKAHTTRGLTLASAGDATVRIIGWLDAEAAAIQHAALDPLSSPRHASTGDTRTLSQRHADALVEVCQLALHTDTLPDHGGERPHLVVTIPYDVLRGQVGTRHAGATPTTSSAGSTADPPMWTTVCSSVTSITGSSTTAAGRYGSATTNGPSSFHRPMWTLNVARAETCTTEDRSASANHTDQSRQRMPVEQRPQGGGASSALTTNVHRVGDTPGVVRWVR
jgi:uncharacterized protein DUF222